MAEVYSKLDVLSVTDESTIGIVVQDASSLKSAFVMYRNIDGFVFMR